MSLQGIKKLELLHGTRFLNLYKATYENKKGQEKTWIIASRKDEETLRKHYFEAAKEKVDAVVLAALHEPTGKLVLIKQFRVPLNDYVYELPAGLIDPNETVETTVTRELKEETGLTLIRVNHQMSRSKTYLSPGMTDESAALIFCMCEGELTDAYLEPDEDITAMLISQEEAKALLESDVNMDIKVFIILQQFVKYGKDMMK